MNTKFIMLTPVFNDWKNLSKLLSKINHIFKYKLKKTFTLIIVNDFSIQKVNLKKLRFSQIEKIRLINLHKNLGSQKALAIGLKYIFLNFKKKFKLIIMDSDGQDNPEGIIKMINAGKRKKNYSIVANRGQRKEKLWFKICYEIYYYLIMIFSFKKIRFGNFSIILSTHVKSLLRNSDIWCALPPVISSNLKKIEYITLNREKRYSGSSKMNFFGLIFHAFRVFFVLRKKILIASLFYIFFIFTLLNNNYQILSYFLIFIIAIFNLSIWFLAKNNKENFERNFKKIIVKKI